MSGINKRGSSAVEMIFALMLFLAFLTVVKKFSYLAVEAHSLSVKLQNDAERVMVEAGRPVCLEDLDSDHAGGKSRKIFGGKGVAKRLTFVTGRICDDR